jgi:hypothetical protein
VPRSDAQHRLGRIIQIDLAAAPDIIRACWQAARLARQHEVRCGFSFFSATASASTSAGVAGHLD